MAYQGRGGSSFFNTCESMYCQRFITIILQNMSNLSSESNGWPIPSQITMARVRLRGDTIGLLEKLAKSVLTETVDNVGSHWVQFS